MYAMRGMAVAPSRVESGQQTRARLLEAAIERMASGGSSVNFEAIAADVGLTRGALYHHFGSVDGLVEAVYREAVRRHSERVIAASSEGTGRERLLNLIKVSAALYGSGTPFYSLLLRLHVEARTLRPHLAEVARNVQRRQREYMTGLVRAGQEDGSIRDDIDAEALGVTVNAALQGMLVQQLEPLGAQQYAAESFGELLDKLL